MRTPSETGADAPGDTLTLLGWDEAFAEPFASLGLPDAAPARVIRADRSGALVHDGAEPTHVALGRGLADTPTTGDWVAVAGDEAVAVLPRRTTIVRRDPNTYTIGDHVLAANVDVVAVVHSLDRPFKPTRIERTLVVAWESGATPAVVLTKADLATDPEAMVAAVETISPGVDVVLTSAESSLGIDRLRRTVATRGRTVVFLGESGAGKSRLVNALAGSELQPVQSVRGGDAKGRHTTTTRDLILLPDGGVVIDTPGLRALGLWSAEDGLDRTFPEIEALASRCRFRDCSHGPEPGCAVRAAIDRGDLRERRLESYQKLQREMEYMSGERTAYERRAESRKFSKLIRATNKYKPPR